jgi:ribosomal protein S18 acetylase RimI-like enzyme
MGVAALHLEVDRGNTAARDLYRSLGYELRDRYYLMTRRFD